MQNGNTTMRTEFWCYEMEAMGGKWWEIYWSIDNDLLYSVEPDEFGDWLDSMRAFGYTNIYINTIESWEALV